jgi:hypothetical protein
LTALNTDRAAVVANATAVESTWTTAHDPMADSLDGALFRPAARRFSRGGVCWIAHDLTPNEWIRIVALVVAVSPN